MVTAPFENSGVIFVKKSILEFLVIRGGDRKAKFDVIENDILNELEKGNYHTHKQIADMIK